MKPPATKTAVALYVGATFLLGAIAGGTVGYGYSHRQPRRPFDPNVMRQEMKDRFTKELSLTPEQQQQLETILKKNMDEFGSAHKEHMDHIRELVRGGRDRIAAILTPEQKVRFEAMEKERKEREKGSLHGGPGDRGEPPPGPPPGK
jgi:Spy/CpxP family protein refolding chaperone